MAHPNSLEYKRILSLALQLSQTERIALIQDLASSFSSVKAQLEELANIEDKVLPDDEIADLMRIEPLPPSEIVALGLTGTWVDMDIEDGAEWVNEQKRKRKERRKW